MRDLVREDVWSGWQSKKYHLLSYVGGGVVMGVDRFKESKVETIRANYRVSWCGEGMGCHVREGTREGLHVLA